MAAIVRASHAISFQLLNRDRHPILGIFDGQQGQTLKLEITNSSRRDLKPKTLTGNEATADNHHFELKFRPGTLNLIGMPAITVDSSDAGWLISSPVQTDDGVSFYLLITKPAAVSLPVGSTISVTLNHLSGDGKRGAHGTRVELKWKDGSLEYLASASGQSPEPLVAGHRMQHLSIVNESGQKHIPLHVDIAGNNKVLNNGVPNALKMRITSLLKTGEGSIQLNPKSTDPQKPPGSVFSITFDAGLKNEPWTLALISQVRAITIQVAPIKRGTTQVEFAVEPPPAQGTSRVWLISPKEAVALGPDESIELTISNIVTSHPSGQTNVYVHYKNIPGYWDGDFVSVIEKAPLVYAADGVGIGTNDPKAMLHVKGSLRAENQMAVGDTFKVTEDGKVGIGIGSASPKAKLNVAGNVWIDQGELVLGQLPNQIKCVDDKHRLIFGLADFELRESGTIVFSPGSDGTTKTARTVMLSNGNVGIGPTSPDTHLHVAGAGDQQIMIQSTDEDGAKWSLQSSAKAASGRFEIINRTAGQNRFTILKDGNVGIGTTTPGGNINIGDWVKADKDGRILELHSPQHEASVILSSNQNADGAHLGGLYFTRTAGQTDAHREVAAIKCRQGGVGHLGGGVLQFFTKPWGGGAEWQSPRMVILENGNVGIGTAKPAKGALEVARTVSAEAVSGYRYMNIHVTDNDHRHNLFRDYSIWATGRIAADEFNAVSDERIKNVRGRSDGAADLCTLLGIEITDYGFRDTIGKGAGTFKKVIGQQVEKIFPQAVSKQTDVVPDIYEQATIKDGWVMLATDLKTGDRVKLITEQGESLHEVIEVTPGKFRVDLDLQGEKVFVFGREVDDLLTVDYDAIAMLNVSATQQLKKELDGEVKTLRAENAELRAANDALANRLQVIESKLEAVLGVMSATNGSNGNGRH